MASLGLPGLAGFVSEFMVVRGAWPVFTVITALAMIGLLMTGAYILKGVRSTLHGPLNTPLARPLGWKFRRAKSSRWRRWWRCWWSMASGRPGWSASSMTAVTSPSFA